MISHTPLRSNVLNSLIYEGTEWHRDKQIPTITQIICKIGVPLISDSQVFVPRSFLFQNASPQACVYLEIWCKKYALQTKPNLITETRIDEKTFVVPQHFSIAAGCELNSNNCLLSKDSHFPSMSYSSYNTTPLHIIGFTWSQWQYT